MLPRREPSEVGRQILVLVEQGYRPAEIAARLGWTEAEFWRRLFLETGLSAAKTLKGIRDQAIRGQYQQGKSPTALARQYALTVRQVFRIARGRRG